MIESAHFLCRSCAETCSSETRFLTYTFNRLKSKQIDKKLSQKIDKKSSQQIKKEKIIAEWSLLIGLPANHHKEPVREIISHMKSPACRMQSYAEAKALKMCQNKREDFIDFNRYLLSRIYPFGGRVDSSNFNPVPYWSAGCQAVCLNFQTGDVSLPETWI